MSLYYTCRHCGVCLGMLPTQSVKIEQLGFEQLDSQEYSEFIMTDQLGNIHVTTICDDCETAFESNPNLHAMDYIIQ